MRKEISYTISIFILFITLFVFGSEKFHTESKNDSTSVSQNISRFDSKQGQIRGRHGYWRVKRDKYGVWWFLSPQGDLEFLNTVTTVQPVQKGRDENGLHYISRDWKGGLDFQKGNDEMWARKTVERIKESGFKGIGAWSHHAFHQCDIPISRDLNTWRYPGTNVLFYSTEWLETVEEAIKKQVTVLRDNINLVGYFIDNELNWQGTFGDPDRYFNHLDSDNPNRKEVAEVIRSIWLSVHNFNKEWHLSLKEWGDIEKLATLPEKPAVAKAKLRDAWLLHLSKDYFSLSAALIRKYDPNHLILGSRFKGRAPAQLFQAARDYIDVLSINTYASDAKLDYELFKSMYEEFNGPIMLTEYSFHSTDGRSGNRNFGGFIWGHVIDQQARADGYKIFTNRLARIPYMIGADWFQWNDEPPSGRGDGEDVNFGIVDVFDKPYRHMVEAIRETAMHLNSTHTESYQDDQRDIWNNDLQESRVFNLCYLNREIIIDGILDDWDEAYRLNDFQIFKGVGSERSDESLPPEAYLGWTESGLYLGIEVFDKNIHSYVVDETSIKHLWRSKSFDCIEFWISTRPVQSDQYWYDEYCHHFLILPCSHENEKSMVIQWHHPWDGLEEHLVPITDIFHKIQHDKNGYRIEIFIPASNLHGFDPINSITMNGNIFVRNWQPRIDYYWKCTELRPPMDWGQIILIK